MSTTTVRIKEETRDVLAQLAHETNEPMQEVLAQAIELYRRQRILHLSNAAYAALREDRQAYAAAEEERRAWDGTLADDLTDDCPGEQP